MQPANQIDSEARDIFYLLSKQSFGPDMWIFDWYLDEGHYESSFIVNHEINLTWISVQQYYCNQWKINLVKLIFSNNLVTGWKENFMDQKQSQLLVKITSEEKGSIILLLSIKMFMDIALTKRISVIVDWESGTASWWKELIETTCTWIFK